MGKSQPSPPPAPNPQATAAASTSTNVATAISNAFLNNTNQITPDGSLNYDVTGNYGWTDPYTGTQIQIPTFTATQKLSPQQQAIQDQTNASKLNLAGMANAQSARLSQWLSKDIDLSTAPNAGDPSQITGIDKAATTFGDTGTQQSTFGDAGDITRSYGPADNFSADRQRVEDSLMARMNPQLAIEKQGIVQQLADQGIRYGSQAYTSAMDNYNRQANDARFAAIGQAGSEQQRMNDMAAQRAGFENAAQQQAYNEAQGRGTFANQAQGQNFQQAAARADFGNAGLAAQVAQAQTGFNAQNMARNQYMNEQYALRNQPINEISSLISGSQISNPNFVNTPNNQIPTTDVAGLINNRFSQDMSIYQQQNQNYQQQMAGIYGLAGGLLKGGMGLMGMSDRREKENIEEIGTVFAHNENGDAVKPGSILNANTEDLPIYSYSFKKDPTSTRHIGPMAQDVEKIIPSAVANVGGRKYLDHSKVMGNILRAA
jgi:endosialidase-like protein